MFGEFTTEATQETHSLREHCLDPKMCLAWILLVPLFRYASRLFCFAPSQRFRPHPFRRPRSTSRGALSPQPSLTPFPRPGTAARADRISVTTFRIDAAAYHRNQPYPLPPRIGAECNRNPHPSATGTNILLLSLCCFFSFPHLLIVP